MRIAVNGFGLIGQAFVRRLTALPQLKLLAINEVRQSQEEALCRFLSRVSPENRAACEALVRRAEWLREPDPRKLPWAKLEVDVVLEAAEFFKRTELEAQSDGGRISVLMTGDLRDGLPDLTVVPGINGSDLRAEHYILCAGSDRVHAVCPILESLHQAFTVEQFAACVERPPYPVRPWEISHRPTDVEPLRRVLPWIQDRGWTCRLEDPHATLAKVRLDLYLGRPVSSETVQAILSDAARDRFPTSVLVADTLPHATGSHYSALIDTTRLRTAGERLWLEIVYDPIEGYVARLFDILTLLKAT